MKFKHYILAPDNIDEAAYMGNIGFEELCNYYQKASSKEIKIMEDIIKEEDWDKFKKQIFKVLGTKLK